MTNLLNSILQKEIGNSNQIILHLENGYWKAYQTSAHNLSNLLGDKSCQKETIQGYLIDTLCILPEIFLDKDLVNYCSLVSDNVVVLKLS